MSQSHWSVLDVSGNWMSREATSSPYIIQSVDLIAQQWTGFQKVRRNKKVHEEEQDVKDAIGEDERERTIRCLLKVMDYELEGV